MVLGTDQIVSALTHWQSLPNGPNPQVIPCVFTLRFQNTKCDSLLILLFPLFIEPDSKMTPAHVAALLTQGKTNQTSEVKTTCEWQRGCDTMWKQRYEGDTEHLVPSPVARILTEHRLKRDSDSCGTRQQLSHHRELNFKIARHVSKWLM